MPPKLKLNFCLPIPISPNAHLLLPSLNTTALRFLSQTHLPFSPLHSQFLSVSHPYSLKFEIYSSSSSSATNVGIAALPALLLFEIELVAVTVPFVGLGVLVGLIVNFPVPVMVGAVPKIARSSRMVKSFFLLLVDTLIVVLGNFGVAVRITENRGGPVGTETIALLEWPVGMMPVGLTVCFEVGRVLVGNGEKREKFSSRFPTPTAGGAA
ncbi:hypothetical protein B0J14DRAFT_606621 [Halenospora varia]|nr:hypothetical protein B0J14DRAFT_606621 [Halenospora varia]